MLEKTFFVRENFCKYYINMIMFENWTNVSSHHRTFILISLPDCNVTLSWLRDSTPCELTLCVFAIFKCLYLKNNISMQLCKIIVIKLDNFAELIKHSFRLL